MKKVVVKARDDYALDVHVFEVKNAKAIVQLVHGMEEHQERYEKFIEALNKEGFSVVSSDLRGHGSSAKDLGFFKEKEGHLELIEDEKAITTYIKKQYPNLPIYLFAHSFGTIITRVLLEENSSEYEKVVLSGYPNFQRGAYIGIFVAKVIEIFRGPKYKSKLLANLSIGRFNKSIQNPTSDCDWISYNEENVKSYLNDPYCGIGFTCSAYKDLFHLNIKMHHPKNYQNVNENLQILLVRGEDDASTGLEKGAKNSYQVLEKAGFKKIKSIVYPHMRHEILLELNNQAVYNDIINFYKESEFEKNEKKK